MYRDAIETAQEADNAKIVEELLKFFVERKEKEFFAATLYTCYDYLRPDLVLEYAWRFNMYEFCMPYMIQLISELKTRVETVHRKNEDREVIWLLNIEKRRTTSQIENEPTIELCCPWPRHDDP